MNILSNISLDERKFSLITCPEFNKNQIVKTKKWNRFQFVSYW